MSFKKILIFARDPGGANSISPLALYFQKEKIPFILLAKDLAFIRMTENFYLSPELSNFPNTSDVFSYLVNLQPSAVITGTSFGDNTERWIWEACQKLKIPCLAILEHWMNYKMRFLVEGTINQYQYPTKIILGDQEALKIANAEALPSELLLLAGNPYNDYLLQIKKTERHELIKKKYVKDTNDLFLVFASESFSTAPQSYGYKETDILEKLLSTLSKHTERKIILLVRPHPKEDRSLLQKICDKYILSSVKTIISSEDNSLDIILASDGIFGMISQFLVESKLLGKKTLSIQIGLNCKDPFFLSREGYVPVAYNDLELNDLVIQFFNGKFESKELEFPNDSIKIILNQLEKLRG